MNKPDIAPKIKPQSTLHVLVTREPFSDFFVITQDNGHTEELEIEETRKWFQDRGADKDKVEKLLDQVWNFQRCEAVFDNPKNPDLPKLPYAPRL